MEGGYSRGNGHICQCLSKLQAYRGEATLTISGIRRRTGQEFVDGVLSLARGLTQLGVKRGHVVAISALNSEWYMEWLLAVASVGAIAAPLNYRWSLEEARRAMEVVNPVMLVVDDWCSEWASSVTVPSLRHRVLMAEFPFLIATNEVGTFEIKIKSSLKAVSRFRYLKAPKDIVLICFTSGTTGRPKGVAISHMSLIVQALAKIAIVGYCEDDVYLHMAPLCHIGGLSSCIAVLMSGGCHIFTPKFDAQRVLQTIEQSHVTSLITVPAMMADLITCARQLNGWNCGESVKKILNGGGELTSQLLRGAIKLFPRAKIISAYGMTEACSSLTFMPLHDPRLRNYGHAAQNFEAPSEFLRPHNLGGSCVGKPPAHIELHIYNDILCESTFCVGRILTRGPHVMIGYYGVTSTSEDTEQYDWLDTGDVGWMDATGNLWLLGRSRDMIKSGGENIYPEEVEHVLLQHPGLSKVAVVGVPHYRLSEIVVACVNIKDEWEWVDDKSPYSPDLKEVSGAILQRLCWKKNLTRFKIPKYFIHWKEPFPLTSTGKLKRDVVRREITNHMQFLESKL